MKFPQSLRSAFTLIELLVVIAIIAILATLAVPGILDAIDNARLAKAMKNGQGLAQAWVKMNLDFAASPDVHVGWPGNLAETDGEGKITTAKDFYARLVRYGGMKTADLAPLVTAPGLQPWDAHSIETLNVERMTAYKIFKVSDSDVANTVFITTKNYTYNKDLEKDSVPFGNKGFVVIGKQGNGAAYKAVQAHNVQSLGLLPGRKDFRDRPQEEQTDYLSMQ